MAGKMHPTRIDIPAEQRKKLVALLNRQLADTLDLYSQTKFAHWNVKGSDFIQLHLLYDTLAEPHDRVRRPDRGARHHARRHRARHRSDGREGLDAGRVPDDRAERDGFRDGARRPVRRRTRRAPGTRSRSRRSWRTTDTSDLFTEVSRQVDKDLWFLEAHVQKA